MPHFSADGNDTYLCQVCAHEFDGVKFPSKWRPDITKSKSAGNVCPSCVAKYETEPTNLYEHCQRESGLTDRNAIVKYMHRHYGHS